MPRRPRQRQCARCGHINEGKAKNCSVCTTSLIKQRWKMSKDKIKFVHALARQKGLDDELYRLRLASAGVQSCKEFKRDQFNEFVLGLKALPDAR